MAKSKSKSISFEDAKRKYVNRFTMEHVPVWASFVTNADNKFHAPQYRTDLEWYENTEFPPHKDFPRNQSCRSNNQSWPLGKWLDKPYNSR